MPWSDLNLISALQQGKVAVMPTDTIYGLVGRADLPKVVERIGRIKQRSLGKPFIILLADWEETKKFGVDSSEVKIPEYMEPTSFIIDNTAFRVPKKLEFRDFLMKTGPLVAPSANPEGLPPAKNIAEARNYFGDLVDLYVDGGDIVGPPSRIIKLHKDGRATIIRQQ